MSITTTHRQETQCNTPDGVALFRRTWLPEGQPCGVFALVHGLNEHSGRYDWLAELLTRDGWVVCAIDLRGHGKSSGPRLWVAQFDEYLDDVVALLREVRAEYPDKPLFLFGHSLGGAIVTRLVIARPSELGELNVAGLILSGPALCIGHRVFPLLRRLAQFASRVWPTLRLVRMGGRYMSRNPDVVRQFRRDPLVFHGRFPVRTGAEILRTADRLPDDFEKVDVPFLVMHGTADVVTDPEGSRQLYRRAASTDKTLHLYDGFYHEVLTDIGHERVVGDLRAWLRERVL